MKFKFLIVLAVICIFVHQVTASGKKTGRRDEKRQAPKSEKDKALQKLAKPTQKSLTCAEKTKKEKIDCETLDVPDGYKGVFTIQESTNCDWTCNYESLS